MENKSLMQMLLDAGYPREQIDHHESDLYVYVTPLTTKVIKKWCSKNGYKKDWFCPIIVSNDTICGLILPYIPSGLNKYESIKRAVNA